MNNFNKEEYIKVITKERVPDEEGYYYTSVSEQYGNGFRQQLKFDVNIFNGKEHIIVKRYWLMPGHSIGRVPEYWYEKIK